MGRRLTRLFLVGAVAGVAGAAGGLMLARRHEAKKTLHSAPPVAPEPAPVPVPAPAPKVEPRAIGDGPAGRPRTPSRRWAVQFVSAAAATVMVAGATAVGFGVLDGPQRVTVAASSSPLDEMTPTGSLDEQATGGGSAEPVTGSVESAQEGVEDLVSLALGRSLRPPAEEQTDCAVQECVALTFDDGPQPSTTGPLLDLLEERDTTATFFVVGGAIPGNEDLLVRMRDLGMEVENHTWSHPMLSQMAGPGVVDELTRTSQEITRVTGVEPTFMRPPYGDWVPGATPTNGLIPMLWDVDSLDWLYRDSAGVAQRVLDGVRPGAVILLHDIHSTTIGAVPAILDGLEQRGLTVASLRELRAGTQARGATDLVVTAY